MAQNLQNPLYMSPNSKDSLVFKSAPPSSHPQKQNCWSKLGFKLVNFFLLLNTSPQFSLKKSVHYENYVEFLSPVPIPPILPCCSLFPQILRTQTHTEPQKEKRARESETRTHTLRVTDTQTGRNERGICVSQLKK
jgi:hypothetical protein